MARWTRSASTYRNSIRTSVRKRPEPPRRLGGVIPPLDPLTGSAAGCAEPIARSEQRAPFAVPEDERELAVEALDAVLTPLFVGLSCVPYIKINEPPEGPNAGQRLRGDFPKVEDRSSKPRKGKASRGSRL